MRYYEGQISVDAKAFAETLLELKGKADLPPENCTS
jgi:hypothetical protein